MKKMTMAVVLLVSMAMVAKAEVKFAYEAGAEVVSAYLWRGQYNGGLSIQPNLQIGYDGTLTNLRVGVWGNIGASDWKFKKGLEQNENGNPNTQFKPELDVIFNFGVAGAHVGFNHYYYCDGSNFFSWKKDTKNIEDKNSTTTEFFFGYDFRDLVGIGLYANWYTTIAGRDFLYNKEGNYIGRAWSSYIELGYEHCFKKIGLTLTGEMGMSPWSSPDIYGNEKFAVTNLSLRVEKEFDLNVCNLNIFAQGMLNTDGINKLNAYINAAGDDKLYNQKLNGIIGLGVWF